jgi:hypothetical protein
MNHVLKSRAEEHGRWLLSAALACRACGLYTPRIAVIVLFQCFVVAAEVAEIFVRALLATVLASLCFPLIGPRGYSWAAEVLPEAGEVQPEAPPVRGHRDGLRLQLLVAARLAPLRLLVCAVAALLENVLAVEVRSPASSGARCSCTLPALTLLTCLYVMYRALHAQLLKSRPAIKAGDEQLIETLKEVSELMVYGDKHSDRFFEYATAFPLHGRLSCTISCLR